jgi:hypothetical protein
MAAESPFEFDEVRGFVFRNWKKSWLYLPKIPSAFWFNDLRVAARLPC